MKTKDKPTPNPLETSPKLLKRLEALDTKALAIATGGQGYEAPAKNCSRPNCGR